MTYPYNTKAAAVGTDKVGPTFWDERVTDPLNELLVELGASPSGSAASVTVRLDEEHNQDGTHAGGIALGTGDIPVLGDYLAVAGDTMEGLLNLSSYYLTGMSYSVGIGYNALEGASYKTQVGTKENPPLVPVVTTTQRGDVTATNGLFLYNDTTNKFELYENGSWVSFLPLAGGTITSTETGSDNGYVQLEQDYTIDPAANASACGYTGHNIEVIIDADNTQPVANVCGLNVYTGLESGGAVANADGIMGALSNYAAAVNIKGGWLHNANLAAVSGFFYGLQANVDNWSTGGLTGSIYRARAGRFRLQNRAQATGGGTANMTTAEVIYANIANGGDVAVAATIGTAAGFYYDLTNDAYGTITTSYGVYLATPVNNGTITNHYGLYLANQSGIGGTDNFAIYSGGGINYFAGDVGIGDTSPTHTLDVNGTIGIKDTQVLSLPTGETGTMIVGSGGGSISGGTYNTLVGLPAGNALTSGDYHTHVGYQAGNAATTIAGITAVGYQAGLAEATSEYGVYVGYQAGMDANGAAQCVALGAYAMFENVTGDNNTVVGFEAGKGVAANSYSSNTYVGYQAGYATTTGGTNTAVGMGALKANTTAADNVAVGTYALVASTTGGANTAIGTYALTVNTEGIYNVAVGMSALGSNTTGGDNVAVGYYALGGNTTTNSNTALGRNAGRYITGGSTANQTSTTSVYLGRDTRAKANADTNEIVIGYLATGLGTNSVNLGNDSVVLTGLHGKVGINIAAPLAQLHVDQASTTGAIPVLSLDQADLSDGFVNFIGTSAASAVGPISTWTNATIVGYHRVEINGVQRWVAHYSDPTS